MEKHLYHKPGKPLSKSQSWPSRCHPYLLDKPLAESRRDPLPSVDAAVHKDGRLGRVGLGAELWLLKVIIKYLLDVILGATR